MMQQSTMVTKRCGLLLRRDVRNAPSKPQNIDFNGAVTVVGEELRCVQALAGKVSLHTKMELGATKLF